jgi:hypoxia up-regulated 1
MCKFKVDFERHNSQSGEESSKYVRRTLFDRNNAYPQKKIMTFNKHESEFDFYLNYGDLSFFNQKFIE